MKNSEKQRIIIFAREAFRKFYNENYQFLSDSEYKPGKKTYRNFLSLNKLMGLYIDSNKDFLVKEAIIKQTGWKGPSSYVQHERIITNFDLSDTSWKDRDRAVLLLNDNGIKLRAKYKKYVTDNPTVNLMKSYELPDFAKKYLITEIKNTTSSNMTLWKNAVITALYVYCVLGYLPYYGKKTDIPLEIEKKVLLECCNYSNADPTYMTQPIVMLSSLDLIDKERKLTNDGYKLLSGMKMFSEVEASISDFEEMLGDEIDEIENILESKVALEKVDAPVRKKRKGKFSHKSSTGPKNRDFDKSNKENKLTGDLGEKLVLDYERDNLRTLAVPDVEDKAFLTSSKKEEYGNAYPCDIISFDPQTGKQLFIEVKTTKGGADTPFYISEEEVRFSCENEANYRLYRVFQALETGKPKFYETKGKVEDNFSLEKERYIASRYEND